MGVKPHILCIVGPTASGKTTLAIDIAHHVGGEILSADSRQIYKLLTIGTAKPSESELKAVPHHFIDILMPDEHFSAGDFAERGAEIISNLTVQGTPPIIAGGTGLYVEALVDGLFEGPRIQPELRAQIEERLHSNGGAHLLEELRQVDPEAAQRMLPTNTRRIIRALEVFYATGVPITEHHRRQRREERYKAVFIGLEWDRKVLYDRINRRVERMIEAGLVDEVRSLLEAGYDERYKALQTVGYKEAFAMLRNEISFERMVELIKQNTRRFAKRQLTWFRYDERIRWFPIATDAQIEEIAAETVRIMTKDRKSSHAAMP